MNSNPPAISSDTDRAAEAARYWVGLLFGGDPSPAERAAFEAWLNASPVHRAEFQKVKRAWDALGGSDRVIEWTSEVDPLPAAGTHRATASRRAWLAGASGVAAGAAAIFLAGPALRNRFMSRPAEPARYASGIAETRTVELDDGTVVTLGGASAVDVTYTGASRELHLLRGSAYFDVARDASRPLTVAAANSRIRVLGTAFSVRLGMTDISVTVSHGAVSVGSAVSAGGDAGPSVAALKAGRRAVLDLSGKLVSEAAADLQTELSWIEGYLAYESAPLAEVVADINRYRVKQVRIEDVSIANLRITVSFRDDQSDQFLAGLTAAYPVTVSDLPEATVIRAKR